MHRGSGILVAMAVAVATATAPADASRADEVPTHHVRGSVTVEAGGYVEDVYLDLTDDEGNTVGSTSVSGTGGTFDMPDVVDGGPYTLTMSAEPDYDWRTQYYPDTYFRSGAAPITVAGADLDLQPMTLHLMHDVHGAVDAGGQPVTWMRVTAYPAGPGITTYDHGLSTSTDEEDGTYDLRLPPGTWKIRYSGVSDDPDHELVTTWAPTWYSHASSFVGATPIAVPLVTDLGPTTLTDGGSISGSVTDSVTGLPVRDIDVQVVDADNRIRGTVVTRNDGSYRFGLLATGSYKVKVLDNQAHAFVTQYYGGAATNPAATPVPVVSQQETEGIDVVLVGVPPPDPSTVVLGGVVTDQAGVAVRGVAVSAVRTCGATPVVAFTDLTGHYAFSGLTGPSYRLTFDDSYGDVDDDSFDHMGAAYGGPTCSSSTPVPLGTVTADVSLTQFGGISGTLTSGNGTVPRHAVIEVYDDEVYDEDDYPLTGRAVSKDGSWVFGRLAPGTYKVFFDEDWGGYITHWWQDSPTRAEATEITVTAGAMASGLDDHLDQFVDCGEGFIHVVGTPKPGETLSVAPGTRCAGSDLTYSYTWLATSWSPFTQVQVGTGPSYTVQPDDWGYDLSVKLHATGPDGSSDAESVPMPVQAPATFPPDPVVVTAPTITGPAQVGQTMTASPGVWRDQQQLVFSYLWIANGYSTDVTTPTYVVRPEDQGAAVQVRVDAARRLHHTWAYSPPVVIGQVAPPSSPFSPDPPRPPPSGPARLSGTGHAHDHGVQLVVRVPSGYVRNGSTPGVLVVTEGGRRVASFPASHGSNRLDLRRVSHGRHTYVVSFTGTIDGMVPQPVVVKVRVPSRG